MYFPRSTLVQRCFPIDTFEILNELQAAAIRSTGNFLLRQKLNQRVRWNCQLENNVISRKIAEGNFRVSRVRWLIDHVLHREAKRSLKSRGWLATDETRGRWTCAIFCQLMIAIYVTYIPQTRTSQIVREWTICSVVSFRPSNLTFSRRIVKTGSVDRKIVKIR